MDQNNIAVGERAMKYETDDVYDTVVIGVGANASHSHCVIIGNGLDSDYEYQVKVGNSEYNKSRKMTPEEFKDLQSAIIDMFKATITHAA